MEAAMLFRPNAEQNLPAIETMLDNWNGEADRFRRAAMAVRKGEPPDDLTFESATAANDGLQRVLADIETALDRLPAGDRRVIELLQVLVTAQALAESVERSWEVLSVAAAAARPIHIPHEYAIAAE
jgi:hypothetical protein